jgi:alanine racemase
MAMKRSWVEVDLGVLTDNLRRCREALTPGTEIVFVVKADAYGHGAVPVARRAFAAGVQWFAVAYLQEAMELRPALPEARILVLGAAEPADVPELHAGRIIPVVVDESHGAALGDAAAARGIRLAVHLKIDTGMGRLGVEWPDAVAAYRRLIGHPGLDLQGVCSHFAASELDHPEPALLQAERFRAFNEERQRLDPRRVMRHHANSRAVLYFREWDYDAVRPGIMLYGYCSEDERMRFQTRPILQWKAHVIRVKPVPAGYLVGYDSTYQTPAPTTLAVLCVGYADGYFRWLSNCGAVLIGGRRCPVVGRVSMNWVTVDAGPDAAIAFGDEAVLIGRQGDEAIWADELADLCHTIPYEILTSIDARLERRYVGA